MTHFFSVPGHSATTSNLIEDAIARHGAMHVLLAVARAVFRTRRLRRERPPDIRHLDARMRRDIGLLTELDAPDRHGLRF